MIDKSDKNFGGIPPVHRGDIQDSAVRRGLRRVFRRGSFWVSAAGACVLTLLILAAVSLDVPALGLGAAIENLFTPPPAPVFAIATPPPTPAPSPPPSAAATPTPSAPPSPVIIVTPEPSPEAPPDAFPAGTPIPTQSYGERTCYLTFDDGPSKITPQILDVLKEKGVRATFFLIGDNTVRREDVVRRARDEGHLIANHTQTHEADRIYSSPEALLADIEACSDRIAEILGEPPLKIFRFPRGSSNKAARPYHELVSGAGYAFFDWNVLNGDAESTGKRTPEQLMERLIETQENASRKKEIIVLMHDTGSKLSTAEMLPAAIDYLREQGYSFETLDRKLSGSPARPEPTPEPIPEPTPEPAPLAPAVIAP